MAKWGVRTAEEVLAHCVLTPAQKEVLECSNTWLEEVLEQGVLTVFQPMLEHKRCTSHEISMG